MSFHQHDDPIPKSITTTAHSYNSQCFSPATHYIIKHVPHRQISIPFVTCVKPPRFCTYTDEMKHQTCGMCIHVYVVKYRTCIAPKKRFHKTNRSCVSSTRNFALLLIPKMLVLYHKILIQIVCYAMLHNI